MSMYSSVAEHLASMNEALGFSTTKKEREVGRKEEKIEGAAHLQRDFFASLTRRRT